MTPLAHRQFYPQELEALLHYNGLEITGRFGDFFESPVDQSSVLMVLRCRAAKKGRRAARPA